MPNTDFVTVTGSTEHLWLSTDLRLHFPVQLLIIVLPMTRVWNSGNNQWEYVSTNVLQNLGSLSLSQNIGFTGGSISLNSDLTLQNDFENDINKYITVPLSVRLTQPIFRYNALKWQKKTEPLKYDAAKKDFPFKY